MMPVNDAYPIEELIKACKDYFNKTGRRISFEYAMISGVNDSDECAFELASRLKGMLCHVNLIPLNKVVESGMEATTRKRAEEIAKVLESKGIPATVRRELGADIDGACGQLRLSKK